MACRVCRTTSEFVGWAKCFYCQHEVCLEHLGFKQDVYSGDWHFWCGECFVNENVKSKSRWAK